MPGSYATLIFAVLCHLAKAGISGSLFSICSSPPAFMSFYHSLQWKASKSNTFKDSLYHSLWMQLLLDRLKKCLKTSHLSSLISFSWSCQEMADEPSSVSSLQGSAGWSQSESAPSSSSELRSSSSEELESLVLGSEMMPSELSTSNDSTSTYRCTAFEGWLLFHMCICTKPRHTHTHTDT